MCIHSTIGRNKKYTENQKNGGQMPAVNDTRTLYAAYKCGNCIECRKQKAREWQIRLYEHIKEYRNGKMVTLTFSTESLKELSLGTHTWKDRNTSEIHSMPILWLTGYERENAIATLGVRRFTERWRKQFKKAPAHWLITELGHGNTEHIHLHGIMWTDETFDTIRNKWEYGYIYPRYKSQYKDNYVSDKTVNYMMKYVTKIDLQHQAYKPKIYTSKGIGHTYVEKIEIRQEQWLHLNQKTRQWTLRTYNKKIRVKKTSGNYQLNQYKENGETNETYRTESGHKVILPIYYRNKIYNEEEKEKLWIEKLNKQERWICGEKVSIKEGEEEYYNLLAYHQKRNKSLGYGGKKNWKREIYENERRNLIFQNRTNAITPNDIT